MRGIPLSAGTPPQDFSLLPQPFYNDTWLYNSTATFCSDFGDLQEDGCVTQRGGLYALNVSSSSSGAPTDVYNAGGDPSDIIDTIGQEVDGSSFIKDTLLVPNVTALADFPIGMPGLSMNTFYNTQGAFGLGSNSTIVNALMTAGHITSRSFSWWWGLNGATKSVQADGQLVLGGYDVAKVQGKNCTQPLAPPSKHCHTGMVLTISDMVLEFVNGTSASFLTPNVLTTCIIPEYPLMVYFPWIPYFDIFESLTATSNLGHGGGNGLNFEGMLYSPDNVFEGDLTIKLGDEFQIQVPNDLLVVPQLTVQSDGSIFANHSFAELLLGPTAGNDNVNFAILGRYFFQSAYLTVDYDAQTFTISQANPVTDSHLVSLDKACLATEPNSPNVGNGTNHTSSSGPNGGHSSHPDAISTGAIVGIVVGSVSIAAAAIITAFLCYLRKRKRTSTQGNVEKIDMGAPFSGSAQGAHYDGVARMAGFQEAMSNNVQEMQSRRSWVEMNVEERPSELTTEPAARTKQKRHLEGLNSPVELA